MESTWQLYRSTDSGDNWELQGTAPPVFPTDLFMVPSDLLFLSS
jgi:hypothetical protein